MGIGPANEKVWKFRDNILALDVFPTFISPGGCEIWETRDTMSSIKAWVQSVPRTRQLSWLLLGNHSLKQFLPYNFWSFRIVRFTTLEHKITTTSWSWTRWAHLWKICSTSINNHLGIEQSRRDDLESIGYVLIYFLKGSLPWQGLKAKNPQKKYRMILEKKQQVSIAQLCQGCPSQFAEFLVRLKFAWLAYFVHLFLF